MKTITLSASVKGVDERVFIHAVDLTELILSTPESQVWVSTHESDLREGEISSSWCVRKSDLSNFEFHSEE